MSPTSRRSTPTEALWSRNGTCGAGVRTTSAHSPRGAATSSASSTEPLTTIDESQSQLAGGLDARLGAPVRARAGGALGGRLKRRHDYALGMPGPAPGPSSVIEDYVLTICRLQVSGEPVIGARLAEQLHVAPASITEMLGRLLRDG